MDQQLDTRPPTETHSRVVWLSATGRDDVALVGGKNASLGEMIAGLASKGISVPDGFATTTAVYRELVETAHLQARLDDALASYRSGATDLAAVGTTIRSLFLEAELPDTIEQAIVEAYRELGRRHALVRRALGPSRVWFPFETPFAI